MNEKSVFILFPHHLFKQTELLNKANEVVLLEEHLFFTQYKFHKQKILFHRASMKYYSDYLRSSGINAKYVEATDPLHHVRDFLKEMSRNGIKQIYSYEVCDDWLMTRMQKSCSDYGLTLTLFDTPLFLNSNQEIEDYFPSTKKFLHADFYIQQRKKLSILVDQNQSLLEESGVLMPKID